MARFSDKTIKIDQTLSIEDMVLAANEAAVIVGDADKLRVKIQKNHQFFRKSIEQGLDIYGVTSGFGASSHRKNSDEDSFKLQTNLTRYHRCGVGMPASYKVARATMVARLKSLCLGASGIEYALIESLENLLSKNIAPVIPQQGSVGASGDLTPLAYLAAVLQGEHSVIDSSENVFSTQDKFKELGLTPIKLKGRDGLALMNGTSFMTAAASLAWYKAKKIADESCRISAVLIELLDGRTTPYSNSLHLKKPHPGSLTAAQKIRELIDPSPSRATPHQNRTPGQGIQDPYSLRCSPHVTGVLYDVLDFSKKLIETELNGVSDNPLFLDDEEFVLNGGHFYGGHIAMACDTLKNAVASTVNLMDRQIALLFDGRYTQFIPENLTSKETLENEHNYHHGLKALQITLSSLAAECAKNAMPMSVFSRPTEASNQDVVSMGTIAARDLENVCTMAAQVSAIALICITQAAHVTKGPNQKKALDLVSDIAKLVPKHTSDRPYDGDIAKVCHYLFEEVL